MVPNMGGEPHCFGYLDSAGGIAETTAMVAARSEITFIQAEERVLKLQVGPSRLDSLKLPVH